MATPYTTRSAELSEELPRWINRIIQKTVFTSVKPVKTVKSPSRPKKYQKE